MEGCWGWLRAQPAPSGREGMPWDPAVPGSEEASAGVPWKMQDAPGLSHNLLDECSGLSGLQFELFSGYFGFFCSINPLFKLGLPSWVYQSLAFSSVFLRLGDIPSRKVFPATAELCSLPHLGSESLGFGKAAGLTGKIHQGEAAGITGELRWSHLAQHIQGICKGCSSRPWKRHKDLNLLFWQVQGGPTILVFHGMSHPGFVTHQKNGNFHALGSVH